MQRSIEDGRRGSITLIIGPMFARKTSTMCNAVERHHIAGRKCVIVKHQIDTRYSGTDDAVLHTHAMRDALPRHDCPIHVLTSPNLADVDDIVREYDVVGVSELQFFTDVSRIIAWADRGQVIVAEGLDGDHTRSNFGNVHRLLPEAEHVVKLTAVCLDCGADAPFTVKISGACSQIDVGGAEKYRPVCRACYNKRARPMREDLEPQT